MLFRSVSQSRYRTDVMNKRIEIYHSETKPVGKYYVDRNLSVTISGIGEVEEVAERILASI